MRGAILGFLVLAGAALGLAADQPISGVKLVLSRSSSGAEKLTFVSKDVSFLFPAIGGPDDPSVVGASVTVVSPLEPPVTLGIPSGTGNPGWKVKNNATLDSYQFTNGSAPAGSSVVRSGKLREKRGIKIVARETGIALTAAQGSVGIRISTGTLHSCARFVGSSIVIDQAGRFVGRGAITAGLADCSDAALGAPPPPPPVCGNGVREGSEQCDGDDGLDQAPPYVACGDDCQFCAQSTCRFPGPIDIPCCSHYSACIIFGPAYGTCATTPPTTSTTTTTSSTTITVTTTIP